MDWHLEDGRAHPGGGAKIVPHLKPFSGMAHRNFPEGRQLCLGSKMLTNGPLVTSRALWEDDLEADPGVGRFAN